MRKRYKPFLFLLAIAVLTIGMATQASAQTGSITIRLEDGAKGTSKAGVSFLCDKVANLIDGEYQLAEALKESKVNLNELKYASDMEAAAKKLYTYTTKKGVPATTDKTGVATFSHLDAGMYLIYTDGKNNYEIISPTLVSVPTWDEQQKLMDYEVIVIPKHSPTPNAPQTGDHSQLLLCCGAVLITGLICIAILLNRRERRRK